MGMADGFDDRQAQSRAALAAIRRDAIKAIEYPLMMIGIDADAGILDLIKALSPSTPTSTVTLAARAACI